MRIYIHIYIFLMDVAPASYGTMAYDDPSRYGRPIRDISKIGEMTEKSVTALCVRNEGYESPWLNDTLYLHYAGFNSIPEGVLDAYHNTRSLFFQANGLKKIENIEALQELRALYLQQNCIQCIENLSGFRHLIVLNLANNGIETVPPGSLPPALEQLNLSRNHLNVVGDIQGIFECPKLNSVDVSYNNFENEIEIMECWQAMSLDCLFLHHNPCSSRIKNYRRRLISTLSTLRFLDARPVETLERVGAEAWSRGEQENDAKRAFWQQQADEKRRSFDAFRKIQGICGRNILERRAIEREAERLAMEDIAVELAASRPTATKDNDLCENENYERQSDAQHVQSETFDNVNNASPAASASSGIHIAADDNNPTIQCNGVEPSAVHESHLVGAQQQQHMAEDSNHSTPRQCNAVDALSGQQIVVDSPINKSGRRNSPSNHAMFRVDKSGKKAPFQIVVAPPQNELEELD
eukprot:GEMP01013584.1.p1 GENE.GEMP01013584.1~~GEMP01013584.1.p1  ORF type:complete len:467 (+),score=95.16 GEMP01013584.1:561-1961(+)